MTHWRKPARIVDISRVIERLRLRLLVGACVIFAVPVALVLVALALIVGKEIAKSL